MAHRLITRAIVTHYPCCNGVAHIHAIDGVPRETYIHRCGECSTKYLVQRRTFTLQRGGPAATVDILDWTDTATRLYTNMYGK